MPLPKQAIIPENRVMKAPYNFVPLPEAVLTVTHEKPPEFDRYDTGRYTGFIDLTITNTTLLYTRCAYLPRYAAEKVCRCPEQQQFFHHGDPAVPVLPGSSIRGMLLSLVEIISFSRMLRVHDSHLIFREVNNQTSIGEIYKKRFQDMSAGPDPFCNLRAGYLKSQNGQWMIQPSVDHGTGATFVRTPYPSFAPEKPEKTDYGEEDIIKVWLIPPRTNDPEKSQLRKKPKFRIPLVSENQVTDRKKSPGERWVQGTLVRSGHIDKKGHHCIIYEGNPVKETWLPIERNIWEQYENDRNMTRGIPTRPLKEDGDPLFYLLDSDGNLIFFGPTQLFRLSYQSSTRDMIPEFLREKSDMDLAETIFGSTQKKGRVRVQDARLIRKPAGGQIFASENDGRIALKTLSSPKPTSFQAYIVQNQPDGVPKDSLFHYDNPYRDGAGTVIRGHKLYWNQLATLDRVKETENVQMDSRGIKHFKNSDQADWRDADDPDATPQQTVIRPVRAGCEFAGRIHFENLSKIELGVLLTALKLKDNTTRHRLGMGKPFGMGTVRIEWKVTLIDRKVRYSNMQATGTIPKTDAETIVSNCLEAFEKCLLDHHLKKCGGNEVTTIWDIPRLNDVALMLGSHNFADAHKPDYLEMDSSVWKERNVLPSPQQVVGKI